VSEFLTRLHTLMTGRCTWIDTDTGELEHDVLDWRSRWAIFGVHSSNWKWVRTFGKRDCGCTFNPLTRRKVLTNMECPTHGIPIWKRDSFAEEWCTDDEWAEWYTDDERDRKWM
jgi:hypothetical protein